MGRPEKSSESYPDLESTGEVEDASTALKKTFNIWSTLGISYSITSTPLAIGTYLSLVVGIEGSPGFFFAYILAVSLNLVVCLSLAELSSVFPHTSGKLLAAQCLMAC